MTTHPQPPTGSPAVPDMATLEPSARQEWLSAYLDGELTPLQAQAVTAWLDEHPEALREVEHLRRMWDLLEAYPDEPVTDGFAERVLAKAHVGSRGRVLELAWYRRPLTAAAALLIAFGGGALLWSLKPAGQVATPEPTLAALEALDGSMLADDGLLEVLVGLDDETFDRYLAGDFDDLVVEDQG